MALVLGAAGSRGRVGALAPAAGAGWGLLGGDSKTPLVSQGAGIFSCRWPPAGLR